MTELVHHTKKLKIEIKNSGCNLNYTYYHPNRKVIFSPSQTLVGNQIGSGSIFSIKEMNLSQMAVHILHISKIHFQIPDWSECHECTYLSTTWTNVLLCNIISLPQIETTFHFINGEYRLEAKASNSVDCLGHISKSIMIYLRVGSRNCSSNSQSLPNVKIIP